MIGDARRYHLLLVIVEVCVPIVVAASITVLLSELVCGCVP